MHWACMSSLQLSIFLFLFWCNIHFCFRLLSFTTVICLCCSPAAQENTGRMQGRKYAILLVRNKTQHCRVVWGWLRCEMWADVGVTAVPRIRWIFLTRSLLKRKISYNNCPAMWTLKPTAVFELGRVFFLLISNVASGIELHKRSLKMQRLFLFFLFFNCIWAAWYFFSSFNLLTIVVNILQSKKKFFLCSSRILALLILFLWFHFLYTFWLV